MKQCRVLVVADEQRVINFLNLKLRPSGYDVIVTKNGSDALEQVHNQEPDLVVLDVTMPGTDGFKTLKEIRAFSQVPVIILSSKGLNIAKIKSLGLSADEYLAKPINPDKLVARIEAIKLHLSPADKQQPYEQLAFDELIINFKKRLVTLHGEEVHLTRIEWRLLSELAQNAGTLMLYSELLTRVWGPEYRDDVQILRTWISRLRNKIESNINGHKLIRTVQKIGYTLDQPSS